MNIKLFMIFTIFISIVIFSTPAKSQTSESDNSDSTDKIYQPNEVSTRVRVFKISRPSGESCHEAYGKVKLKAVFRKTGKITNVEVEETSSCESFNKNALKAV